MPQRIKPNRIVRWGSGQLPCSPIQMPGLLLSPRPTRAWLWEGLLRQSPTFDRRHHQAAHRTGADAVHPGYRFFAENAAFAQAVIDYRESPRSRTPAPWAVEKMGSKLESKRMASRGRSSDPPERRVEQIDDPAILTAGGHVVSGARESGGRRWRQGHADRR